MRVRSSIIAALFFLVAVNAIATTPHDLIIIAQAITTSSPNALDAQDRFRDRERERADDEIRERLGDPTPDASTRGQGFAAPTTNDQLDIPDIDPRFNQNRER